MNDVTPPSVDDVELRLLVEAIYHVYHYDFRRYARASLRRRMSAAMAHFGCRSLSELQGRLLREADVFTELLEYLTVQVSDLFRDPGYFRALREKVVPLLRTYPSLKIWIAGCSTGEEAYSMAILLREEGLLERSLIYATDINPNALRRAEAGIDDAAKVPDFTANHRRSGGRSSLSDYYSAAYDRIIFDKHLRKNIVFSDHSLATDSVFAEVQLVSCRNVMIYFDRELQSRALDLFYEALCRKGFLGIGLRESLRFSSHADSFAEFVREDRIYRKVDGE